MEILEYPQYYQRTLHIMLLSIEHLLTKKLMLVGGGGVLVRYHFMRSIIAQSPTQTAPTLTSNTPHIHHKFCPIYKRKLLQKTIH